MPSGSHKVMFDTLNTMVVVSRSKSQQQMRNCHLKVFCSSPLSEYSETSIDRCIISFTLHFANPSRKQPQLDFVSLWPARRPPARLCSSGQREAAKPPSSLNTILSAGHGRSALRLRCKCSNQPPLPTLRRKNNLPAHAASGRAGRRR